MKAQACPFILWPFVMLTLPGKLWLPTCLELAGNPTSSYVLGQRMPSNRGCTGHLLDTAVPTPPPTSLIDGFSTLPGCSGRTTPHHESPGVGYVAVPSGGCSPWAKNPHPEQQVAAGRTFVSVRAGFSSLYLNRQGTRLRRLPQGEQRAWVCTGV